MLDRLKTKDYWMDFFSIFGISIMLVFVLMIIISSDINNGHILGCIAGTFFWTNLPHFNR
jgi:RsiW-degrading membrane proteinase PrsW (M82 family)